MRRTSFSAKRPARPSAHTFQKPNRAPGAFCAGLVESLSRSYGFPNFAASIVTFVFTSLIWN
jgi:hypothetical protein